MVISPLLVIVLLGTAGSESDRETIPARWPDVNTRDVDCTVAFSLRRST